jgi:hypothetical protein
VVLRYTKVAAELALENSINPAGLLLGPQLASVIRFALRAPLPATAVLAGGKPAFFKRALRSVAALTLQK